MTEENDHDILIEIRSDIKHIVNCQTDHEIRIRGVENNQLKVLGVGTLTGFIAGFISRFIYGGN